MKKILTLILFLGLSFTSCDYLDKEPDDNLTIETAFSQRNMVDKWLASLYSNIPDPYMGYISNIGFDLLGDDLTMTNGQDLYAGYQVLKMRGNWSVLAGWEAGYWTSLPQRIREANIFLENVHPVTLLTATRVEQMKGEARFLIAYYYWLLLESYGPIPFNPGVVYTDFADYEGMMLTQTPYDDIVNWIDNELQEVATLLPAAFRDDSYYGRATAVMCHAVRARMLLFAASPLVNGNPDYAGHVNKNGVELFNSTYDAAKWQRAAAACKTLIEVAEGAGHRLHRETLTNSTTLDPIRSYQMALFPWASNNNTETLFARPESDYGKYEGYANPRGCNNGTSILGVTQALVDDFLMKDGLPTGKGHNDALFATTSPLYDEAGFSTAIERRSNTEWTQVQLTANGSEKGIVTREGTFNMYCNREPRFYASVLYDKAWINYGEYGKRRLELYPGGKDNPDQQVIQFPEAGYLAAKKVHPDYPGSGQRYGIIYRLAEAYLSYAEALNEYDPGNADILRYVNYIRERAGIPQYGPGGVPAPVGREAMREAIHRERRIELNGEGVRYNDIRRWKIGELVLNKPLEGMNARRGTDASLTATSYDPYNPTAFYVRTPFYNRRFKKEYYWMPIEQSFREKNPNLVQNPYWN
jgi:hypothetical protein